MIDRRTFIRAAGTGIAVVALATEAQQAARLPRIGVLYLGLTIPPSLLARADEVIQ